jgi:hypothetical protein
MFFDPPVLRKDSGRSAKGLDDGNRHESYANC